MNLMLNILHHLIAKYHGYGPINLSLGFSRNYLNGGKNIVNYVYESDARKIVFENFLTSNLLAKEYTVGGHDYWDQTISTYFNITYPEKNKTVYGNWF